MAKTEDIEAKLAAYVDGDVDPAGRAEIEKHLANNPKHRDLLADLSRQRDLLRALPRDMAPADVAETINSQLERAVLLGDVDGEAEIAGSIGPWSQLRAIAAVLILTGGLAGVIYYLLPFSNRHGTELADLRGPSAPATFPAVELAMGNSRDDLDKSPRPAESRAVDPIEVQASVVAPTTEPALADAAVRAQIALSNDQGGSRGAGGLRGSGFAPGALDEYDRMKMASNAMPTRQEIFSNVLQTRSEPTTRKAESEAPSVYVVSTDNPESTERDIREYFKSKNITWESAATEPMPRPIDQSQQQGALAFRQQQPMTFQLKSQVQPPAQQLDMPASAKSQAVSEQRIVARQVTREQAVAIRDWLDQRQGQKRLDDIPKDPATGQAITSPSEFPRIAPATSPSSDVAIAPATQQGQEGSPTTLPVALEPGLGAAVDLSPVHIDAPGIELESRKAISSSAMLKDSISAPTTQAHSGDSPLLLAAPTTLPDLIANERVDVVIVLEPQAPMPAILPATTEPSGPANPQQP